MGKDVSLAVVILAAGQGKRMKSDVPKVLQLLAEKPMLAHVVDTAKDLGAQQTIVVTGHKAELVQEYCKKNNYVLDWVNQDQQLGTGHAVQTALPAIKACERVLILYGDVPLVMAHELDEFISAVPSEMIGVITAEFDDPDGLGRIIRSRDQKYVHKIVEDKDASPAELSINEINTGIMLIPFKYLEKLLTNLSADNQQGEYYLTDVVELAKREKVKVVPFRTTNPLMVMGVNDQQQLAECERNLQFYRTNVLLEQGVKLYDPFRVDVRGSVEVGQGVSVDINVIFEGHVRLGNNVKIEAGCILKDVEVADDVTIHSHSVLDNVSIAHGCKVGPFARLRPGTQMLANSKVGNFVEVKNSVIGVGSKANHLSYLGDAEVGSSSNIGAGTITCNYDGVNKFSTKIGNNVFIGSNCELIAPVTVGDNATIAAGTTLMKDAPSFALTMCKKSLSHQIAWKRPEKQQSVEEK